MKRKIRKNGTVLVAIALVIFIGTLYLYYFKIGTYVNTDAIIIHEMKLDDYILKLNGNTLNSGQGYSGYRLQHKNKSLFIQLRYSLVSFFNPSGEFVIVKPGLYEGIEAIYLQGRDPEDIKTYLAE